MPKSGLSKKEMVDHLEKAEDLIGKIKDLADEIKDVADKIDKYEELQEKIRKAREDPEALDDTRYGELMADLLLLLPGYDFLPDPIKKIVEGLLNLIGLIFDKATQFALALLYKRFREKMDLEGGPSDENAKKAAAKSTSVLQLRLWLLYKWAQAKAPRESDADSPEEDDVPDYVPLTEEERLFLRLYFLNSDTAGLLKKWLLQIKELESSGNKKLKERAERQKEVFRKRVDELIRLYEDLLKALREDLKLQKKELKVHPKIGMKLDGNPVELTGYVAAFDPDGTTEIWSDLAGSVCMTVASQHIIDSWQDDEGFTRLTLPGETMINVVRRSSSTVTAGGLSFGIHASMGPGYSIRVGTDKQGRPIYAHLDWHGAPMTWPPKTDLFI